MLLYLSTACQLICTPPSGSQSYGDDVFFYDLGYGTSAPHEVLVLYGLLCIEFHCYIVVDSE